MIHATDISRNDINIYFDSKVASKTIGKAILLVINLIIWCGCVFTALIIPPEEGGIILALILFMIIGFFTIGRYTFWNIWCAENIVISPKSIKYQHNYGLFKTNEKTITFDSLSINFDHIRKEDGVDVGYVHFFEYGTDLQLQEIFRNSILITRIEYENLVSEIDKIFDLHYES